MRPMTFLVSCFFSHIFVLYGHPDEPGGDMELNRTGEQQLGADTELHLHAGDKAPFHMGHDMGAGMELDHHEDVPGQHVCTSHDRHQDEQGAGILAVLFDIYFPQYIPKYC